MCRARAIATRLVRSVVSCAAGVLAFAAAARAGEPAFTIEVVDTTRHAGYYTSLAFGPGGIPAVSWQEGERLDLWYSERPGASWQSRVVATALETGYVTSLAFDAQGQPLISFDSPVEHYVRLARRQGPNWSTEPVDYTQQGFTSGTSLAVDSQNRPWIAYQKMSRPWLAHREAAGWVLDPVESAGLTGWYPSLALVADVPHLSYGDVGGARLRYAVHTGAAWDHETPDPGPIGAATTSSIAIGPGGEPGIAYHDAIGADLRYAERNAGEWTVTLVDTAGDVGIHTSLAFDGSGEPWIAYLHRGQADLRLAHREAGTWIVEPVDTAGRVGAHASLRFDPLGHAVIAYLDITNGALKLARRSAPSPSASAAVRASAVTAAAVPDARASEESAFAWGDACPGPDAAVAPTRGGQAAAVVPSGFADHLVAQGFVLATGFCLVPGGRALVTERRTGRVRLVQGSAIHPADPAGTIDSVRSDTNEEGLVGIALDPRFPEHPYVYVSYDWSGGPTQRVERYTLTGDLANTAGGALALDPSSARPVLVLPDSNVAHNVGGLRFDRDRRLIVAVGDDGSKCASQDLVSLRGKLLRVDVHGIPAGAGPPPALETLVPPDNPWASHPDPRARIAWQNGLRNPFSFSLDPFTNEAFIADVGQIVYEELDYAPEPGMNFGWPHHEGPMPTIFHCVEADTTGSAVPIAGYFYPPGPRTIISAGAYRHPLFGPGFPAEYEGNVFYAEFYLGTLHRLRRTSSGFEPAPPVPGQPGAGWAVGLEYPVWFDVGLDGALWYLAMAPFSGPAAGQLRRIAWIPTTDAVPAPATFELAAPRPSPARGPVTVGWSLPRAARAEIAVRDIAGRHVRTLADGEAFAAGPHTRVWDARDTAGGRVPPGLYVIELRVAGEGRRTRAVALLR